MYGRQRKSTLFPSTTLCRSSRGEGVSRARPPHPRAAQGGCDDPARMRRSSRSEEHTSELQSRTHLVCRLLLAKKDIKMLSPAGGMALTKMLSVVHPHSAERC